MHGCTGSNPVFDEISLCTKGIYFCYSFYYAPDEKKKREKKVNFPHLVVLKPNSFPIQWDWTLLPLVSGQHWWGSIQLLTCMCCHSSEGAWLGRERMLMQHPLHDYTCVAWEELPGDQTLHWDRMQQWPSIFTENWGLSASLGSRTQFFSGHRKRNTSFTIRAPCSPVLFCAVWSFALIHFLKGGRKEALAWPSCFNTSNHWACRLTCLICLVVLNLCTEESS